MYKLPSEHFCNKCRKSLKILCLLHHFAKETKNALSLPYFTDIKKKHKNQMIQMITSNQYQFQKFHSCEW